MHTSSSPHTRRNTIIRAVATVCGDIAAGAAIASACVWIIESAALGLFLSFLVWLIGTLLALAVSQFVIHPAAAVLLSDRKLDNAVDALAGLGGVVSQVSVVASNDSEPAGLPAEQPLARPTLVSDRRPVKRADGGERISKAQQVQIHKLAMETGVSLDRALSYFGVSALSEIAATDFLRVIRSLEKKRAA